MFGLNVVTSVTVIASTISPILVAKTGPAVTSMSDINPAPEVGLNTVIFSVLVVFSASPAQSLIAFASDRGGNYDIYTMDPDGGSVVQLTSTSAHEYEPAWSPDGSRIAFVSERDGNRELYVMNADGSAQSRVTSSPLLEKDPAWSPDGQHLAFTSQDGLAFSLNIINLDGSGEVNFRTDYSGAGDGDPSWSPDGAMISFMSHRGASTGWNIYTMNADGSAQDA